MLYEARFARAEPIVPFVSPLPSWAERALDGVPPTAASELLGAAAVFRTGPGVTLFRAADPPSTVFFVCRGTLRVHAETPSGAMTLALLGRGDLIGEMSALDGRGRSAAVTTVEPSELACLPRAIFSDALSRLPALAVNVARLLSERLRLADQTIVSLASMEVDRRVARQLLTLATRYGLPCGDEAIHLPLRLTQQDLASLVGASRERTNRAVVAFKRRGWIAVDSSLHMTLLRPDLLEKRLNSPY